MKATLSRAAEGWTVVPMRFALPDRRKLPILLLLGLLLPAGCQDRGGQKARQEAAEAKTAVARLELRLAGALQEISDLKAELKAVKQTRDELQEQTDKVKQDRDQALTLAQQAKEVITDLTVKADGQVGATASLEKQIATLKEQVQKQEKIIEDLQKKAAAQPVEAVTPAETPENKTPPTEPNEKP
jgi:chromosome segregation ATPase